MREKERNGERKKQREEREGKTKREKGEWKKQREERGKNE